MNVPLNGEPALLVSGRAVHLAGFEYPPHDAVATDEQRQHVHAAMLTGSRLTPDDIFRRTDAWLKVFDLPHMMAQSRVVDALWDLIHWNEESLVEDATALLSACDMRPRT